MTQNNNVKRKGILKAVSSLVLQIITVTLISLLIVKMFNLEQKSDETDEYQLSLVEQNKKLIEQNRELIEVNQKRISLLQQELANVKTKR